MFNWAKILGKDTEPESAYRWTELATYNAERHRGIVHTPEYAAKMAVEQINFNAAMVQQRIDEGWVQDPRHPNLWRRA